ncbi:MAG: hypothetical protein IJ620_01620 [Bacteroidales bacterium]|nr:hypothetical protein [Bacteroidales bacterium]
MKKQIIRLAAIAVLAVATLASCISLNNGAAISSNSPIGPKMGEANSGIILGLFSHNGKENNIQRAAENGGIRKVSHVEYLNTVYWGGIYIKHTTRVWGE